MEQSLYWEGNRSSASQENPHILWSPMVYFPVYIIQLPALILSQINQVHVHHPISSISILLLSSHLSLPLPSGLFLTGLHNKTPYATLYVLHTCHIPRPSHISFLYLPNDIMLSVQIISSPSYTWVFQKVRFPIFLSPKYFT